MRGARPGLVTPDQYVLGKQGWAWRVVERRPGRREVVVRLRAGGGTEHITQPASATAPLPALSDRQLHRLARVGAAIERQFGTPQDIEWAFARVKLFILQARPITALPGVRPLGQHDRDEARPRYL